MRQLRKEMKNLVNTWVNNLQNSFKQNMNRIETSLFIYKNNKLQ